MPLNTKSSFVTVTKLSLPSSGNAVQLFPRGEVRTGGGSRDDQGAFPPHAPHGGALCFRNSTPRLPPGGGGIVYVQSFSQVLLLLESYIATTIYVMCQSQIEIKHYTVCTSHFNLLSQYYTDTISAEICCISSADVELCFH